MCGVCWTVGRPLLEKARESYYRTVGMQPSIESLFLLPLPFSELFECGLGKQASEKEREQRWIRMRRGQAHTGDDMTSKIETTVYSMGGSCICLFHRI